jgi:hypothetical protein
MEPLRRAVDSAISAHDIHEFCLNQHPVQQGLNNQLVSAIYSPFFPPGFVKTQVPKLFGYLQQIRTAAPSQIAEICTSCLSMIRKDASQLQAFGTYGYLLPLFRRAQEITEQFFEKSDATKPAKVWISPYEKKYPLHQVGGEIRLRFVVRNDGPGPAQDIDAYLLFEAGVEPQEGRLSYSAMDVGAYAGEIAVRVVTPIPSVEYYAELRWTNYGGHESVDLCSGVVESQRPDVDWADLTQRDPYSLEPVAGKRLFVGRRAILDQLVRAIANPTMGSAIVYGQKRVGKTSLAHELIRELQDIQQDVKSIYIEGGDYVDPTAEGTLRRLGQTLCRRIRRISRSFERVPVPEFKDSLGPFVDFIEEILEIDPNTKFLLVLDEFDELPLDLYTRGPIGDAFFLTLRSLSGRARIGVILVGGEKIGPILDAQGEQLNKWVPLRIDHFDKEAHWTEFKELIRGPVSGQIDFADEAIEEIYRRVDGNPFFTNVICQGILQLCTGRRDAFVTKMEVEEAIAKTLQSTKANSFQHFWEDGILGQGNRVEEVSIRRRRILLAMAYTLRRGQKPTAESVCREQVLVPVSPSEVNSELKRFVERGVFRPADNSLECRVKLFEDWLRDRGPELVSVQFTDREERIRVEEEERESYVTSMELQDLARGWGTYRGRGVTTDAIRAWLDQFTTNHDKRLMFQLLHGVRFYTQDRVREKLREAMGIVKSGTTERKREGERSRRDILVTALGGIGKSGTKYARLFAQENKIISENVLDLGALQRRLETKGSEIQAVIIVDDFIGTGESASTALRHFSEALGTVINARGTLVFYLAVCGFEDGHRVVRETAQESGLPISMSVCDTLEARHKAFSEDSGLFLTKQDQAEAEKLVIEKGLELEPDWPRGFGHCEALVVFDDSCPNNSLPILWKKSKTWTPLFPRV